ncbi:hypothetical protein K0M31_007111 [Melipona bicolor]|uniref:Uncharacterized protein n=1 Tax=Melipona bicolor TaxID=60889 RepID=A0AA40FSB7_9HYME|nr:hypothetical protein K0M31_007111 [Melipona bicolor]
MSINIRIFFISIYYCSGTEQNTPRQALRSDSRNTLPCRESPDVLAFSHLRTLSLTLRIPRNSLPAESACGKARYGYKQSLFKQRDSWLAPRSHVGAVAPVRVS